MNIDYLYSVIDLYLKNENEHSKTNLNIQKADNNIQFSFTMKEDNPDKTTFYLPIDLVNNYWYYLLNRYKKDLLIIDEKYEYDKVKNTCYYYVLFKNGRIISFNGFSIVEINGLRNCLYSIRINEEEIRINLEPEKETLYQPMLSLQHAGFSTFKTIFFITLFILDILVISLWVCKIFIK